LACNSGQVNPTNQSLIPMTPPQEQPAYVLWQNKKRAIIPSCLILLILSIILYIGILVNISLLDLTGSDETIIKTTSLIVIFFLMTINISITIYNALQPYNFYRTKITFKNKELPYSLLKTTTIHRGFFDRLFKTYTLPITKTFIIKNIPDSIQLQPYIEQLITYSKTYSNATSSSTSSQSQTSAQGQRDQ
ncbi:MAG: hypothetical protein AABX37_01415, partial [Nanoarchaeota archaeon]